MLILSAESDLIVSWDREAKGVPIGRPAEVNLRNNHTQYIFTWYAFRHSFQLSSPISSKTPLMPCVLSRYALAAATSVMLWMVVKKPPADLSRRVRQSKDWS